MSSSLAIILGVVVLALTGVIVLLVRELVLRAGPRVQPPPPYRGPLLPGPVYRPPRVNRFGELEDR